jgi:hypothetical protein
MSVRSPWLRAGPLCDGPAGVGDCGGSGYGKLGSSKAEAPAGVEEIGRNAKVKGCWFSDAFCVLVVVVVTP